MHASICDTIINTTAIIIIITTTTTTTINLLIGKKDV